MIQKNWQELIKPTNLQVTQDEAAHKAKIVVEPLERGFGLTLGNALRRVLLSSLQGGAVSAIKIDGVLHEFSSFFKFPISSENFEKASSLLIILFIIKV